MKKILLLSIFLVSLFFSCKKAENPYVSKEEIDALIKLKNPDVEHVALIYKNDVYYLENITKPGKRITNTPGVIKRLIKMSHDHKKFAYLEYYSSTIVITDINGTVTNRLSQYSNIKSFDWSADDQTLYILSGNKMVYFGTDMKLPDFTYNGITAGSTLEVLSASVSMKGDLAYVVHGYHYLYGDKYKMIIKPANKSADVVFEDNSTYPTMRYVAFSSNNQDLVLGYISDSSKPNHINQAYVFINFRRASEYSFGSYNGMVTPLFNESKSFAVTTRTSDNPSSTKPIAIGFNKQKDRNLTGEIYTSENDAVYTDWK
ncbi:hypothetical protein [Pedobacter sp. BMA]|uniref:hypothetical protein n=1 Tax=Pedobacter sp. BMA TaxID=1663685 RepID=UPI00064A367D|nr:hypothetical protein [Pedobacter sp. BMA]KLT64771.1 hypothetical protein AB669_13590 [Pedobacter sp. BMA]